MRHVSFSSSSTKKCNSHPLEPNMSDWQLRPDVVQWNITVKEKAFFWNSTVSNRHHMWTCRCIMSDEESSCFLGATFYLCGGDLKVSTFSVVTIVFFLKKKISIVKYCNILNKIHDSHFHTSCYLFLLYLCLDDMFVVRCTRIRFFIIRNVHDQGIWIHNRTCSVITWK